MKNYYVYILTNQARGTLYIGVTNNLNRRIFEHTTGQTESFSKKYRLDRLVYVELTESVEVAIEREKQLKNWHRQWKINLIESANPGWVDLAKQRGMDAETSSV